MSRMSLKSGFCPDLWMTVSIAEQSQLISEKMGDRHTEAVSNRRTEIQRNDQCA